MAFVGTYGCPSAAQNDYDRGCFLAISGVAAARTVLQLERMQTSIILLVAERCKLADRALTEMRSSAEAPNSQLQIDAV